MPYKASLHQYLEPAFYQEAPESWERRLREISPITETLSHLAFRWWEPHESWNHPTRGQWSLYSLTPAKMVHPEKVEQLRLHWSELDETRRAGRKAMVSDYQHFIWHTRGYLAQPFLILQGEWGGTPAKYTETERQFLRGSGAIDEPYPLGFFPACPFDERTVNVIAKRDRLIQVSNNMDELAKLDRPASLRAQDEAAERVYRETYLDTWREIMQPSVEFMQSYLRKSEADMTFRPAPEGTADAVSQWKDHWIEHGRMIGVQAVPQRRVQVLVG